MELQQAVTLRFDLSTRPQVGLTIEQAKLITPLSVDRLVILTNIQSALDQYFSARAHQEEWTQQLSACQARLKTLELRARNLDQELSKGGLFRAKKNEGLQRQRDQVSTHLTQVHGEITGLESRLSSLDQLWRALAERISIEEDLEQARWISTEGGISEGLAITLTEEGRFLLDYLSEMLPEAIKAKDLSQVLIYGHAWSISYQG